MDNDNTFKESNFVKFVFVPSEKGFTLKGKNAFRGSKLFPFRVDTFQKGLGAE